VAIRQEGWQKNWGRKIRVTATFNFFLPSFFRQLKARGQTSSIKPRITGETREGAYEI
jgi:hypothetical protein